MNDKQKTLLIRAFLAIVGLLLVIIFIAEGISTLEKNRLDVTEGLAVIEKEESADITAIENKIASLDAKDTPVDESTTVRSTKELFASSVVLGDSIAMGFSEYDILNSSSVVAEIGIKIEETDKVKAQIDAAKMMNPQAVFLCYGINDVREGSISTTSFADKYKLILDYIKEEMPDTKIYVNAIFPVHSNAVDKEPNLEKIDEYNEKLSEACDKRQVAFLNNTDLVKSSYYEEDGIHFVSDFYVLWADYLAEVAEL